MNGDAIASLGESLRNGRTDSAGSTGDKDGPHPAPTIERHMGSPCVEERAGRRNRIATGLPTLRHQRQDQFGVELQREWKSAQKDSADSDDPGSGPELSASAS